MTCTMSDFFVLELWGVGKEGDEQCGSEDEEYRQQ